MVIDGIQMEVSFKPIKNLYLRVSRQSGKIRVSAPLRAPVSMVEKFVRSKANWIDNQRSNLLPETPSLLYNDGDLVSFFGSQIPIKHDYTNKSINAYLCNNAIMLEIKADYGVEQRQKILDKLYRTELNSLTEKLVRKWEPIMNVRVQEIGIKKMKTKWGTCNICDKRIWLSLYLAKKRKEVIEMVVVHEMVHLLERLHNKRFYTFMDQFLPDWKERSQELDG